MVGVLLLQVVAAALMAAAGAWTMRRSRRIGTIAAALPLALILFKAVVGHIPALEASLFPWDWYPYVEPSWYLVPAMFLAGAPIQPGGQAGARCHNCYETGAAATLLYLLGLPIAHDLQMSPATDVIAVDFIERNPLRYVKNYDAAGRRASVRTGQPLDAEALERLRSLGYIR